MCRQADYLQPDCVLFSDKCSAINEFCVTRRSANAAVAVTTKTADPNRLSRGEKETNRTAPTKVGLSRTAGCWLVERGATVLCCMRRHGWRQERLSEKHTDESGSGLPCPGAPPLQGQIGVKSLCPGGLSLFALRSRAEPRTKQLPHVPPGSQNQRLRLGRDADDESFQLICVNTQKLGDDSVGSSNSSCCLRAFNHKAKVQKC